MYEFTCQLATQKLLAATHGNREALDGFVRMNAGTTSPAEFFAPENVIGLWPPQLKKGATFFIRLPSSDDFAGLRSYPREPIGPLHSRTRTFATEAVCPGSGAKQT